MGPLTISSAGPVYLDATIFIYSVERVEPYRTLLDPIWQQVRAGEFAAVSSEITVLETLVKPLREDDTAVERLFRSLFDASEIGLIPATRELWEDAARLRAETGLKTPDALHAATAIQANGTHFVTNDSDFRRVPDLPVVVLDDLLKEEAQV